MSRRLGLLRAAAFSAPLAAALVVPASVPAEAARPGDASRFDTWVGYDVGRYPTAVEAADLDGDGLPDAAWARDDFFENSLSVTLNLGDGTLGAPRTYPTTAQSTDVAAADLDQDGDVDLAVSARGNSLANHTVDLFLNDGTGAFEHATTTGGSGPERITAGDVDADGDADLVLANYNEYPSSTVTVLRNAGDATFTAESTAVGFRVHDVVIGDLTGDGTTDLGAVRVDEEVNRHELHVLEQREDGTFAPDSSPQRFDVAINGGVGQPSLAAADLDADDDLDLVVSGAAGSESAVLANDGTGSFAVTTYPAAMVDARLADLDDDGDVDIAGVGGGGGIRGTLTVLANAGDGTFAAPVQAVTGSNPLGIAVADLQADGRPDVLVAARDIGSGVTHRQHADGGFAAPDGGQLFAPSVEVTTGDVDADGDVDVVAAVDGDSGPRVRVLVNDGAGVLSDGAQLATGTDPRSLRIADLDGDGDADVSWLAGHYGAQVVSTALGNGDGTFAPRTLRAVSTCGDHLTYGDLDGDGDPDQVVGNDEACSVGYDRVSVSLNDGTGAFPEERLVPMAEFTGDLAVADVDRDGTADLVGASSRATTEDIAVALGTGGGELAAPVFTTTGAAHREIVVRDLDADGDVDIASTTYDQGTAVLFGDRSGTFPDVDVLAGEHISGYRNAVGLAVGDVDGDAIADIVVANESGSDVGLHRGLGGGAFEQHQVRYGMRPRVTDVAIADLNGDGVLDVISPAQLPGGFASARTTASAKVGASSASAAPEVAPAVAAQPTGLSLLLGARPACTIVGTPGPDRLVGTSRTDVICGRGGADRILGRGGSDVLWGQDGDDVVYGGPGYDVLRGGPGADQLLGGLEADALRGDAGGDRLDGGGGGDTLDLRDAGAGAETGNGGAGTDHCLGNRSDVLTGCP